MAEKTTTKTATKTATEVKILKSGDAKLGRELVLSKGIGEDLEINLAGHSDAEKIVAYRKTLDMSDSKSILFFGTSAQNEVTSVAENMLSGVKNKDTGETGAALSNMLQELRGFRTENLGKKPNFFARLFGQARNSLAAFTAQFEDVTDQIETISIDLEKHKTTMLQDIEKLDRLYDSTLDYFHDLELWIAAGEQKLHELDTKDIPALEKQAEETGELLDAQAVRDLRAARDDLERRVHDLRLTRQVTMQSLPSIRLLQDNDKSLVNKITSVNANTVPLWKQQIAQSIAIYNAQAAGKAVKAATDLTNDMLSKNAENLRTANKEIREQVERGIFDIDVVQKANNDLIATIQESLEIADEAKAKRAEAVGQLAVMEGELKTALKAAALAQSGAVQGAQEEARS